MTDEQPGSASAEIPGVSAEFRLLRESVISDERQEREQAKYVHSLQREQRQEQTAAARRILVQDGPGLEYVHRMEAQQERILHSFLEDARPPLVERPPAPDPRIGRTELYRHLGDAPTLLGAELSVIEPASGELREVWLQNPDQIKDLKAIWSGSGWGCWLDFPPPIPSATWWYTWRPPVGGMYRFSVSAFYSGFGIINSTDTLWNCKYAKVSAWSRANVHQLSSWLGEHGQQIVERYGEFTYQAFPIDELVSFGFYEALEADFEIIVRIRVTLAAEAEGGGSYAELNFADGQANYLGPPLVRIKRMP